MRGIAGSTRLLSLLHRLDAGTKASFPFLKADNLTCIVVYDAYIVN